MTELSTRTPNDFQHWDLHQRFTMHEAAMLWIGQEPSTQGLDNPDPAYQATRAALVQALKARQLDGVFMVENSHDPDAPVLWTESSVYRDSLVEWALSRGVRPAFLARDLDDLVAKKEAEASQAAPAYSTALLRHLNAAIDQFWREYNPKHPPKSEEVIAWLEKRGVSNRAAQAIDLIIRPDSTKGGGAPKPKKDAEEEM